MLCFPFITLVLTMFQTAQFLLEVAFPFPTRNVDYKIKILVFVYRTEQFNFCIECHFYPNLSINYGNIPVMYILTRLWHLFCVTVKHVSGLQITTRLLANANNYAPLEKGGIMFCNGRSVCRYVGL